MKHFNLTGKPPVPYKRGGVYYVRLWLGGRDKRVSLRTGDKKQAQIMANNIWYEMQSDTAKAILPLARLRLIDLWQKYSDSDKFLSLADSTRKFKSICWHAFLADCNERKIEYCDQLTAADAIAYLDSKNIKNKTFNNILTDLSVVFEQFNLDNPFKNIAMRSINRGDQKSTKFAMMTDEEMNTIEDALSCGSIFDSEEWLLACRIARYTGLRYKDIAFLQWSSIQSDDNGRYIEISPFKTAAKTGGMTVLIRICSQLDQYLSTAANDSMYIIPIFANTYNLQSTKIINRLIQRLGIRANFHSYRVSFATRAIKAGADAKALGGVLGHTTTEQTQSYNRAALSIDTDEIFRTPL